MNWANKPVNIQHQKNRSLTTCKSEQDPWGQFQKSNVRCKVHKPSYINVYKAEEFLKYPVCDFAIIIQV